MTYTPAQIAQMENGLQKAKDKGLTDIAAKIQSKLDEVYSQQAEKKSNNINLDRNNRISKTPKTRKTAEVICDVQIEKIVEQAQEIQELKEELKKAGVPVRNLPAGRGDTGRNVSKSKKVSSKNAKNALKQEKERVKRIVANGGKPETKKAQRQPRPIYEPQSRDGRSKATNNSNREEYSQQKEQTAKARRDTNIKESEEIAKRKKKFVSQPAAKAKPAYTGRTIDSAKKLGKRVPNMPQSPVIVIDEQVKIIKSFVGLFVGTKTEDNFKNLYARIKKALLKRKIKEGDTYTAQIMDIQKMMYKGLTTGGKLALNVPEETMELLQDIAQSQKVSLSVTYLSQYISLMKSQDKAKIAKLAKKIETAIKKGAITENSYYYDEIQTALGKLKTGKITLNPVGLAGLENIINGTDDGLGCLCNGSGANLNGIDADELSGADLYNSDTKGIGFTGAFLELMGDPTPAFSAVVFGPAKAGKTIFNMLFADYLQTYFGNVLYVSFEEFGSPTLAIKVKQLGVNPNITFRGDLNADLNAYQYCFLDSATKTGMTSEQVEQLKKHYPNTAFITILQVTKEGKFRGTNDWVHNTQIIIEVTDGWADAYGRFGAGELDIFHLVDNK